MYARKFQKENKFPSSSFKEISHTHKIFYFILLFLYQFVSSPFSSIFLFEENLFKKIHPLISKNEKQKSVFQFELKQKKKKMKGSISVFNLSSAPSVEELVLYFGNFGKIEEVEQISQRQNNTALKDLAMKNSVFPNSNSSEFPQMFNTQSFASILPKGYENKSGVIIHYSEFEDANEAALNLNGIEWKDSQIFVAILKKKDA